MPETWEEVSTLFRMTPVSPVAGSPVTFSSGEGPNKIDRDWPSSIVNFMAFDGAPQQDWGMHQEDLRFVVTWNPNVLTTAELQQLEAWRQVAGSRYRVETMDGDDIEMSIEGIEPPQMLVRGQWRVTLKLKSWVITSYLGVVYTGE